MVMLTATTAEWVHHQKRSFVGNTWRMVLAIAYHHIGRGKITQTSIVGHERRRKSIEGNVFAIVGPHRVAGDLQQELIAGHLFNHTTGFHRLAWIVITLTRIFI